MAYVKETYSRRTNRALFEVYIKRAGDAVCQGVFHTLAEAELYCGALNARKS